MKFEALLAEWADALRLTNALYGLYKQQRERVDAYQSRLTELIKTAPLTDKDWTNLRKRIEENGQ